MKNFEIDSKTLLRNLRKETALLRILRKDFDDCRLTLYDLLSSVLENDEHLELVNYNIEEINIIKDLVDELKDDDGEGYKNIDLSYFKRIDRGVFVDALVEVHDIEKSIAKELYFDIYGELWVKPTQSEYIDDVLD